MRGASLWKDHQKRAMTDRCLHSYRKNENGEILQNKVIWRANCPQGISRIGYYIVRYELAEMSRPVGPGRLLRVEVSVEE